ncbi:hypothetical protein HDU87_001814 [Geranomyces variabilis]|uniref:RING-type domain-containing protein n=1 Tax=Geranomyces variabilis TaxID=109894 RepID=A0AAD5TS20_9FUNG|nr:hypothetical protein HDU87_001814 [Geranomyces variabilis]
MVPNVVYKYALLTAPMPPFTNSTGQDLVGALPEVTGDYTGAQEQTGNINAFDNMPLASDVGGIRGLLVDYGNGCPFPPFPYLPPTASHIALLNITQGGDPACKPLDALQRALDRMAQTNGIGLIALGDKDDSAIKLLTGATYSHQFPAYLFQDTLGRFLLDVMKSANSSSPPFRTADPAPKADIVLVPNAPFPANFTDPKSPDGIVHIGVRIDIDDVPFTQFPPIWRFAVVSLGIFFAFSIPAVFFLKWRAARYARQFPPGPAPVAPATIDAAALVKKHPVARFGSIMERYNGEPTCSICIDEFESDTNVRVLQPCGHAFHPECVDRWVMEQAAVCPMCRQDLLDEDGGVATTGNPIAADQNGRPLAAPAPALPRPFWRRLIPRRMGADDAQVLPTTTQQAHAPPRRSATMQRDADGNAPWWKALLHNRSLPRATRDVEAARSNPAENLPVDIPLQNRTPAAAAAAPAPASPRAPPLASTAD